ncbi:hypothetical protein AAMO2058_000570900 [Amorphochlora amoebiformis]
MEEAPAPTVRPDPYAVSLAKGDHPATFGIILTTLWRTAPSDLSSQLESLREEVLRATGDDCLYFYPYSALHCTVASLLKFTSGLGKHLAKADEKEQTAYIDKWKALVDKVYSHKDFPRKPAKVTFQRPELPGTTAIILIENQGKEVFQIRDLLKQECKEPPDKYHLQINIPEITHFPNIVHSSVARFKSPPKGNNNVCLKECF